jgi:6-methylsalicylate decarboxylase
MIIDVHAHYYPRDYLEFIGATGVPYASAAPLASLGIDERLALMDRTGVHAQVLSISATQPYSEDTGRAVKAARLVNDRFAEVCREHRGRFYAFGALPLPHLEPSLEEMARCIDELEMVGITMGCSVLGHNLAEPLFDPIYAELNRRAATLFLHPSGDVSIGPFGSGSRLNILVGFYIEDTVAAVSLAEAGIPSRYPDMKIIVPHLGGLVPLLVARLGRVASPVLGELRKIWFDTLNDQAEAVTCACAALGPERFVYGTDYPYASEAEYKQRLNRLSELGLSDAEVARIQGGRVAALLGLHDEA